MGVYGLGTPILRDPLRVLRRHPIALAPSELQGFLFIP
jgi:hypothetical protein